MINEPLVASQLVESLMMFRLFFQIAHNVQFNPYIKKMHSLTHEYISKEMNLTNHQSYRPKFDMIKPIQD